MLLQFLADYKITFLVSEKELKIGDIKVRSFRTLKNNFGLEMGWKKNLFCSSEIQIKLFFEFFVLFGLS